MRVPNYQPNEVGPVETTRERLRPANNNGGALGGLADGMAGLSRSVSQFADVQDEIEAKNDDTQARLIAASAGKEYSLASVEYGTLAGGAARSQQGVFGQRITSIRDEALKQATTPRMKKLLEERLGGLHAATETQIAGHALKEAKVERKQAFAAQETSYAEQAVSADNPAMRDALVASGLAVVRDRLKEDGVDPEFSPEVFEIAELEYTSKVHGGVVDKMFSAADPDINEIVLYLEAHEDEMGSKLKNDTLKRLQDPLQGRLARSDADMAMGLVEVTAGREAAPVGAGASNLDDITAQAESGGREYDSKGRRITSPVGARGLMQVMPATARDPGFGLRPSDGSPADDARLGREYRAKMEKRYGGDLMKMWGAYNWGPGNVDKAVAKHGDNWLAYAPEETRKYVTRNIAAAGGAGTAYASAPREYDRAAVYDRLERVAAKEGWSPERTERARQEIDRRVNRDEGLLQERRADADEAAAEIERARGQGFTSINQIPRSVWNDLSMSDRAKYTGIAKANSEPKSAEANGATVMTLNQMRFYDPDGFKSMNLASVVGKVTNAELDTLLQQQAKMRTDTGAWTPRSGIVTALNYGKRIGGMDLEDKEETAILQIMEAEANALYLAGGKKPLTDQQYQDLFRSATREVSTRGFFGKGAKPRYELALGNMPASQRNRLIGQFKKATGREPTEDELLRLYRVDTRR